MPTSLSQMIAKGDSNMQFTLSAHKMVKLYVYVVTHLNVRKDSLNARSDYYALLCLFAECSLHSFISVVFSICLGAISISTHLQIDNKRYTRNRLSDSDGYVAQNSCTILCLNTHKFRFWLYFKAITRKWKILTNNKAFCLNQLIIWARFSSYSFS